MTEAFVQLHALLEARSSTRGFAPEPLPEPTLRQLLEAAQRAPSWCNVQPWRVVVTSPPTTARVVAALVAAAEQGPPTPELPFPEDYPSPHREHRRACGLALYGAMGVARQDEAGRRRAWLRNYEIFDAPHLAVVSCHKSLLPYGLLDLGVWLGTLLPAAQALGIATCPMASVVGYPQVLRAELPISSDEVLAFGLALGVVDPAVPANAARTSREPLAANVTFV